jgi:putative ABC transport system permease protein
MRNEKIQLIINDIRSSLPLYLLIFCQLLLVFYVVSSGCDFLSKAGNGTAAQDISYDSRNDNYYVKSKTDDEITMAISGETNELSYYIGENYKTVDFAYLDSLVYGDNISGDIYDVYGVTSAFFDYYNITVEQGRLFSDDEYGGDGKNIPVVVGSTAADGYSVGDKYLDKYEIVGILKSGQYTYWMYSDMEATSVDTAVYMPIMSTEFLKENGIDYPTQLIFAENKNALSAINEKAAELGIYGYNFISINDVIKQRSDTFLQNSMIMIIIGAIILVLCLLSLIETMLTYVRKNISELLIHVICGATINDIILRVGAGAFFVVFLSGMIMAVILHTLTATIAIIITGIISVIISLIPVVTTLKKKSLIIAVKEEKL